MMPGVKDKPFIREEIKLNCDSNIWIMGAGSSLPLTSTPKNNNPESPIMLLNNNFPKLIVDEVNKLLENFGNYQEFKILQPQIDYYQDHYWDVLIKFRDFLNSSQKTNRIKSKTIDELNDLFVEKYSIWETQKLPKYFLKDFAMYGKKTPYITIKTVFPVIVCHFLFKYHPSARAISKYIDLPYNRSTFSKPLLLKNFVESLRIYNYNYEDSSANSAKKTLIKSFKSFNISSDTSDAVRVLLSRMVHINTRGSVDFTHNRDSRKSELENILLTLLSETSPPNLNITDYPDKPWIKNKTPDIVIRNNSWSIQKQVTTFESFHEPLWYSNIKAIRSYGFSWNPTNIDSLFYGVRTPITPLNVKFEISILNDESRSVILNNFENSCLSWVPKKNITFFKFNAMEHVTGG